MDDYELDDVYDEPMDIKKFCKGLEEAWKAVPELSFGAMLEEVFNGYDLRNLTSDDLMEMLNEFVLQNK